MYCCNKSSLHPTILNEFFLYIPVKLYRREANRSLVALVYSPSLLAPCVISLILLKPVPIFLELTFTILCVNLQINLYNNISNLEFVETEFTVAEN